MITFSLSKYYFIEEKSAMKSLHFPATLKSFQLHFFFCSLTHIFLMNSVPPRSPSTFSLIKMKERKKKKTLINYWSEKLSKLKISSSSCSSSYVLNDLMGKQKCQ